jgi:hypothetical protein
VEIIFLLPKKNIEVGKDVEYEVRLNEQQVDINREKSKRKLM